MHPPRRSAPITRAARSLIALGLAALALAPALIARAADAAHDLEDFIAPPGTTMSRLTMLHADYIEGYDRRLPLDTVVVALDNGSRACRVLGVDGLWAVDYTWVYPHQGMPRRWYDAEDLLRVGDSLGLPDDARITFTFGTYRLGMRAGGFEQLRAEAKRRRPKVMPPELAGRLRLKLERAEEALKRGEGR